eukprot:gnl/MRDRNA2_/MRDRNA2_114525_c0_seq1.p1 gnl/MRDRNA2_/MRDRNA2_114525_c0~~gnl/MRDRNA2_/MRDRNA2_114525_c0_seq1.p1  ORF type:complete len:623 (+),score=178.52 gnl/MRDRNA2_/MRDRNA2_114525_c0_seq1:86-1954(+)
MNSVHKVDEWKRRCAEPPPVLRKPDLRLWQSEQQRHRDCLSNAHNATKLCNTTAREEREQNNLEKALQNGRKFHRSEAQARLRRENARLVQKLADVAHRSMSKQNKLAKTPPPARACSSLNEAYRRRVEDVINAENQALLRRLESAKPAIVDVKTGEGSFKKHLLLKQRILRYKRDGNNELKPLPGLLRPTTAPERMTDQQTQGDRSESKRPHTVDYATTGPKGSMRGQSKDSQRSGSKGKAGYHLEQLDDVTPLQNSQFPMEPMQHEAQPPQEQEQFPWFVDSRPDQQPRQDRRGTPPSSTWEESLLFGQRPQTAAGPKTGLDGVEGDDPQLRSNGSSPLNDAMETGLYENNQSPTSTLPASWAEQFLLDEMENARIQVEASHQSQEEAPSYQNQEETAAPPKEQLPVAPSQEEAPATQNQSQESKPDSYSEFEEEPSYSQEPSSQMENAKGSEETDGDPTSGEPSAEFEKYSGEEEDDKEDKTSKNEPTSAAPPSIPVFDAKPPQDALFSDEEDMMGMDGASPVEQPAPRAEDLEEEARQTSGQNEQSPQQSSKASPAQSPQPTPVAQPTAQKAEPEDAFENDDDDGEVSYGDDFADETQHFDDDDFEGASSSEDELETF